MRRIFQTILLEGGSIVATNAVIFAGYFTMRWLAAQGGTDDTRDLAGSVIFRGSALHGLILALVFVQQMNGYAMVEDQTVLETSAVAELHNEIALYDPAVAPPVRADIAAQVDLVLDDEWAPVRGEPLLAPEAWAVWERLYAAVLDLEPQTPRQQDMRAYRLQDIREIGRIRDLRADNHRDSLSRIFWFAAVWGCCWCRWRISAIRRMSTTWR